MSTNIHFLTPYSFDTPIMGNPEYITNINSIIKDIKELSIIDSDLTFSILFKNDSSIISKYHIVIEYILLNYNIPVTFGTYCDLTVDKISTTEIEIAAEKLNTINNNAGILLISKNRKYELLPTSLATSLCLLNNIVKSKIYLLTTDSIIKRIGMKLNLNIVSLNSESDVENKLITKNIISDLVTSNTKNVFIAPFL